MFTHSYLVQFYHTISSPILYTEIIGICQRVRHSSREMGSDGWAARLALGVRPRGVCRGHARRHDLPDGASRLELSGRIGMYEALRDEVNGDPEKRDLMVFDDKSRKAWLVWRGEEDQLW